MALVRISKELIHAVDQQVDAVDRKTYELQVKPLDPFQQTDVKDAIRAAAVNKLWAPYAALRDITPKEWLLKRERVDVTITDAKGIGELVLEGKVWLPPNSASGYGYVEVKITLADLPPDLGTRVDAFNKAREEHRRKFNQIKEQVLAFLQNTRSLNDALKKFPDLALYVPKTYIERVERKVERAGATEKEQETEIEINREMIVAAGVIGALQK